MVLSEMTSAFHSSFTYLALIAVLGAIGGNTLIYLADKKYPSKDDYFTLARIGLIAGVAFAILVAAAYVFLPDETVPHRTSAGDFLELLWVAPVTSFIAAFLLPTITALGTTFVISFIIKSPAALWRAVGALLTKTVGRWCALLERFSRNE